MVYGICMHFAAVDWIMSLQPAFQLDHLRPAGRHRPDAVGPGAACFIVLAWLAARPPLADVVSLEVLNDLGNLLLTFLVIWAYMVFFQFMLIWIANLPLRGDLVPDRSQRRLAVGGLGAVRSRTSPCRSSCCCCARVKQDPARLAGVAGLVLFMQLVFHY